MDLPTKLVKLNYIRQKTFEEEEIKNTREDIISLIKESSNRGLYTGLKINSELFERKNINNLLVNNSYKRKLDIFEIFIKYSDVGSLNVNIPTTILKNDNLPVSFLVQTIKNGKVIARPCHEKEYFNIETEINLDASENSPIYIYKALNTEGEFIYSKESANTAWNSSKEPAKIQHFIQSLSKPASIIRVLWTEGAKTKYFSIINHKRPKREAKTEPKTKIADFGFAQKRRNSVFDYRTLLKKTSQSINNPFKVKNEKELSFRAKKRERSQSFSYSSPEEFYASINHKKETKNSFFEKSNKDKDDFLKNLKKIEKYFIIETKGQFPEINAMTAQVIDFLNKYPFKEDNIKKIVLDFIQNRDKKWFLLKCKDFSNSLNRNLNRLQSLKASKPKKEYFRKQRTISSDLSDLKIEESIFQIPEKDLSQTNSRSQSTLAGLYKNKADLMPIPSIAEIPEQEMFDISSKGNLRSKKSIKEGLVKINLDSTENQKFQFYAKDSSPISCPFNLSRSKNPLLNKPKIEIDNSAASKNPSFTSMIDTYVKNHLNTTADNLDEINLYTQVAKVKNENLIEKYGGSEFWEQFIFSIWNKVLENKFLSKYFKGAKLEGFNMIVIGMFNLFNGTISPKLRRRLRAAHQSLGLSENEFNSFSDIYENTLAEFQIRESDKNIMIAQIKSLKTLICKQGNA